MRRFEVSKEIDGWYCVLRDDGLQVTGYIFDEIGKASQIAQALQGSYAQGYLDHLDKVKERFKKVFLSDF